MIGRFSFIVMNILNTIDGSLAKAVDRDTIISYKSNLKCDLNDNVDIVTWMMRVIHGHFWHKHIDIRVFHNSRLIRWIQQIKFTKQFRDLTKDWIQIGCLAVSHSNHYTRTFSELAWGCHWILFMHGSVILCNLSNSSNKIKISSFRKKART